MSSTRAAPLAICLVGLALMGLTLAWWWLIFGRFLEADTLTLRQAAGCVAANSDLCSLAQALCTANHLLGLRWYAPEVFWAASAIFATGAFLSLRPAGAAPRDPLRAGERTPAKGNVP